MLAKFYKEFYDYWKTFLSLTKFYNKTNRVIIYLE